MSADDETRAAEYRRQQRARLAYKRLIEASLRGDPVAAREVRDAWEPLRPGQAVPLVWEDR